MWLWTGTWLFPSHPYLNTEIDQAWIVDFANLEQIGIDNDEPVGKNDGSISGQRYFDCKPHHGSFVRPDRVEIGDYPVVNEFEEDMEEI